MIEDVGEAEAASSRAAGGDSGSGESGEGGRRESVGGAVGRRA